MISLQKEESVITKPYQILSHITGPGDVSALNLKELEILAKELRCEIIKTVSKNGGHLSSNLGVVELTLAMLKAFDLEEDRLVWDVGHQCYAYKLLTGRREAFPTLRRKNGISGFPKTAESVYDSFIAGHASTSLAAAYGLKRAMTLGQKPGTVAAVIGDGAMTGGLAYEGINNIGKSGENMIVILNDNTMAISKNEGALARYLAVMRSKPGYFRLKRATEAALKKIPVVGEPVRNFISDSKYALKQVLYPSTFFEEFGFDYLGPVDGHDIKSLCNVLTEAKKLRCPVLVHVETQKGKGYRFAMENPGEFHGISKFDVRTGMRKAADGENFSSVFGRELTVIGKENPNVLAVTAAMEHGTGLQYFSRAFKEENRYYDVGIAEEFGVTFSAALSAGGKIPVFAVYSTFLQRGYDQLIHDAAIEKRHVVFGIDRAGIVGDDGETHQGVFDPAFLATVPGMTVFAPANYHELRWMLRQAVESCDGPTAVRYPRGSEPASIKDLPATGNSFDLFGSKEGVVVVTYGRTAAAALEAAGQSRRPCAVLKLNRILPLDPEAVRTASGYERILLVEEGIRNGGVSERFAAALALSGYRGRVEIRAIEGFVPQMSVPDALHALGLDAGGIGAMIEAGKDTEKEQNGENQIGSGDGGTGARDRTGPGESCHHGRGSLRQQSKIG